MTSFLSKLRSACLSLLEAMIISVPGQLGRALRLRFWRSRLRYMGDGVQIDVGVRIVNPQFVSIDDNTWIDNYVIILAGPPRDRAGPILFKTTPEFEGEVGEVTIGKNVHIANFVVLQGHGGLSIGDNMTVASGSMIYSLSHHHSNLVDRSDRKKYAFSSMAPGEDQSLVAAPVVLGDYAAVGLNSIILPGATIGAGSWIGSGSVVSGEIPPNTLVNGNPAQIVKSDLHPGWRNPVKESAKK